jgi:broad specificity phosphatase PhoE
MADRLEDKAGDILVVSHGGMMRYLSAELRRRGFTGPKLQIPKHATLYIYERNPALGRAATSSGADQAAANDGIA